MTNAVLVVGAAVLGLVGVDGEVSGSDVPAGVFLIALGIVGTVFALKHYERFRYHMAFAKEYRNALAIAGLPGLRSNARNEHDAGWSNGWHKAVRDSHLHWWWASLHIVVSVLGAVVVVLGLS